MVHRVDALYDTKEAAENDLKQLLNDKGVKKLMELVDKYWAGKEIDAAEAHGPKGRA